MKLALKVDQVVDHLDVIAQALVTLARLHALEVLAEKSRLTKLSAAQRASVVMDLAAYIYDFAARHYHHKPPPIHWPPSVRPQATGVLVDGEIFPERLTAEIQKLTNDIVSDLTSLEAAVADTMLAAPVGPLIRQITGGLPCATLAGEGLERLRGVNPVESKPYKAFSGPRQVTTDSIFTPGYTLLDQAVPVFGETMPGTVQYLWTTCIGETMAAELCALCSVEYDGLPVAFHRDMAKQAWDEMRHAVYYLDAAVALLPALEASLSESDPLLPAVQAFRRTGHGLPIPRELNLYETILNSTLAERLILFQIQTEAPGAARKKRNIKSQLCLVYPDLVKALEYDLQDEISHGRIGKTWLTYLYPNPDERREVIETTKLLRSVLLLTSFAHHEGGTLAELLDRYLVEKPTKR